MKTARQDRPAPSAINKTTSTNTATAADASISVDVCARARVQFSCSSDDLPLLTTTLQSLGLMPIGDQAEPLIQILHIQVARHLTPSRDQCTQVRDNAMVDSSTLWVLDRSGAAIAGLHFANWDEQITALVIPSRLNWLLHLLLPVALSTQGVLTGHGAAYKSANGRGVVMCGLPHSGKTGATLAAVMHGARFLADDLVVIDPVSRKIEATTLPITVAYSYLQQYPQYKEQIPRKKLAKLRSKAGTLKLLRALLPASLATTLFPDRIAKRWLNLLNTRLVVELPLSTVFSADQLIGSAGLSNLVMLVASQTTLSPEGTTKQVSAEATSQRWLLAVKKETSELYDLFDLHQFAYPATRCDALTNHIARVKELLAQLFAGQSEGTETADIETHALTVNWQQPNTNLLYAGLSELSKRD